MKNLYRFISFSVFLMSTQAAWAGCDQYLPPNFNSADPGIESEINRLSTPENLRAEAAKYDRAAERDAANPGAMFSPQYDTCVAQWYRQAANEKSSNLSSNSVDSKPVANNVTHYQAPRGRCLALKVKGDSIMVENHCGVPVVGQFCFLHSQLNSCRDSTAGSFGPVNAGDEVMIATTADTNPRNNELKYVLCNADAANHDQCHTHHP